MAQLQKFTNNASATLNAGISNSATTIVLNSAQGALFPVLSGGLFFVGTLKSVSTGLLEIVKVTARTADTLTVIRGQENTTGSAFAAGDVFELRPTAQAFDNIYTASAQLTGATFTGPVVAQGGLSSTGTTTVPTVASSDNSTNAASTAFVKSVGYAPLASPTFTGVPAAPTAATGDSSTTLATTAFVSNTSSYDRAQGRLTLTTGVPVTTADVTAATTLYFTPFHGNKIGIYDGTANWAVINFTEKSIAIPATTNTMYDVFGTNTGGVLGLVLTAWTNDTTRATALALQDGIYVKSGTTTQRYLGTIRTTAVSGQTEDSQLKRYVWNYYNRVDRPMFATDSTVPSWTYTLSTYRQANANTANQVEAITGVSEDLVEISVHASAVNGAGTYIGTGIGINSTTTNSAQTTGGVCFSTGSAANVDAQYKGTPPVGKNVYVWLEASQATSTTTWYSSSGASFVKVGILGTIKG